MPVLSCLLFYFILFFICLLLRCRCLITLWVFKEPGKQSGGECQFPGVGIHNYSCLCQPNTTAQNFLLRNKNDNNKNDNNKNCRSCRDFVKRWSCFHVILYGRGGDVSHHDRLGDRDRQTFRERQRVTWCFTPSQPVQLCQRERETYKEETLNSLP